MRSLAVSLLREYNKKSYSFYGTILAEARILAENIPFNESQPDTGELIKYHRVMKRDMNSLLKIADELDEIRSVDILHERLAKDSKENLPRPEQLKALLGAFKEGLFTHFHNETVYLQRLERNESLKSLARAFLGQHASLTGELNTLSKSLEEFVAVKPETTEDLVRWKEILWKLKETVNKVADHALEEEEIIFKISHNY